MALNPFTNLNFPDQQLNRLQDNVQNAISPVLASKIIDGSLFSNLVIVAGTPLVVYHRLGHTPIMCLPVLQNANATIWTSNLNSETLELNASANVTASVWIG